MLLLVVAVSACSTQAPTPARPLRDGPPARIVSINPCADAILMRVADSTQIAAISHYSHDPRATSIGIALARRFPATSGSAEEVVAMMPDLVIAGGHVVPATIAALRRLQIPLIQLGVPNSVTQSNAQIALVARAIGQERRGARLIADIDGAVVRATAKGAPVSALIWQGGGLVPGKGTLADDLLRRTGFRNLSAEYGLDQWDILPLEYLIARRPDLVFSVNDGDRTDRMLSHPALATLRPKLAVYTYPPRLLHCGGPTIIDAVSTLADARRQLEMTR
jgi:iron complex transport system substrate-binding protein